MNRILLIARQLFVVLRFRKFDQSTPTGRSQERYRRLLLTSIFAVLSKASSILVGLFSVPFAVGYLGAERYGMWITATSIFTFLGSADLGIGNGLVNAISDADGRGDEEAKRSSVSTTATLLSAIALLISLVLAGLYRFVPWAHLYNVSSQQAITEAGPASAVFIVCVALNMPLGIVHNVQMGHQEGLKCHLWNIFGAVASLIGLAVAIHLRLSLAWLIVGIAGGPIVARLINWVVEFAILKPWLMPRFSAFRWSNGKRILSAGLMFFVLQLCYLIGTTSDNFIIAQLLGPAAVTTYAITQRLFSATLLGQYFLTPLWPAIGEALARGEAAWAKRTFNRALVLSLILAGCISVPLVLFGGRIIAAWTGIELNPSPQLLIGFALWTILGSYCGAMATVLNHNAYLARQVVYYGAASIAAVLLKLVLVPRWDVPGAIWATLIGYTTFFVVPAARIAYSAFRENMSTVQVNSSS